MKRILLIGETCKDEYVYGTCDRVCPEAAALCFNREDREVSSNEGMAGNVARNILSISDNQIGLDCWTNDDRQSMIKRRYVDTKYNTIVFREDVNDKVKPIENIIDLWQKNQSNYDAIVISDYNKGFLSYNDYFTIRSLFPNSIIFADTKKKITNKISEYVNYFKINATEYKNIPDVESVRKTTNLIVTSGSEGATLFNARIKKHYPTPKIEIRDVCGAGDTFLAALVVEMLRSGDIDASIDFANVCAGKVVSKFGVCVP